MRKLKRTWEVIKEFDTIRSLVTLLLSLVMGGISTMLSFLDLPAWGIALGGTIACAVLIHIGANMLFRAYDRRTGEQRQRVGEGLLKLIDSLHQNKADDLLVKDLIRRIERMELDNPPRLQPFTD